MADSNHVESLPAIALLHPCRLLSEDLVTILQEARYQVACQAESLEATPLETLSCAGRLIFLVGGQTPAQVSTTVRAIRDRFGSAYILALGAPAEPGDVMSALEAGADGYLREAATASTLVTAIELLVHGETVLPAPFLKALPLISSPAQAPAKGASKGFAGEGGQSLKKRLSPREESILRNLIDGAPNKVIAQKLSITEATVKLHVKSILKKISVQNRTQAAIWATRNLVPAEAAATAIDKALNCVG